MSIPRNYQIDHRLLNTGKVDRGRTRYREPKRANRLVVRISDPLYFPFLPIAYEHTNIPCSTILLDYEIGLQADPR